MGSMADAAQIAYFAAIIILGGCRQTVGKLRWSRDLKLGRMMHDRAGRLDGPDEHQRNRYQKPFQHALKVQISTLFYTNTP